MVEWTAITVPGAAVRRIPSGPSTTSRTWASSSTVTDTRRAVRATSAPVAAAVAPSATNGSVVSGRTSHTTSPPGQARRRFAIGAPMLPRPMNPTGAGESPGPPGPIRRAGFCSGVGAGSLVIGCPLMTG